LPAFDLAFDRIKPRLHIDTMRPKLVLLAALASGISASAVYFPAHAADRSFLIGSFEELLVEGDMQVILDNNRSPSAKASGDRQLIEAVKIERNGRTLRVRIQEYEGQSARQMATTPLVIRLGGRDVNKISVDGSANLSVNQMRVPGGTATVKLSGPGSIRIDRLESDRLSLSVAGQGNVSFGGGAVRVAQFGINGGATLDAAALRLQQAKLAQTGNAATSLQVTDTVEIVNSGSGSISVDGNATCFIRQPGSARIKCGKTAK